MASQAIIGASQVRDSHDSKHDQEIDTDTHLAQNDNCTKTIDLESYEPEQKEENVNENEDFWVEGESELDEPYIPSDEDMEFDDDQLDEHYNSLSYPTSRRCRRQIDATRFSTEKNDTHSALGRSRIKNDGKTNSKPLVLRISRHQKRRVLISKRSGTEIELDGSNVGGNGGDVVDDDIGGKEIDGVVSGSGSKKRKSYENDHETEGFSPSPSETQNTQSSPLPITPKLVQLSPGIPPPTCPDPEDPTTIALRTSEAGSGIINPQDNFTLTAEDVIRFRDGGYHVGRQEREYLAIMKTRFQGSEIGQPARDDQADKPGQEQVELASKGKDETRLVDRRGSSKMSLAEMAWRKLEEVGGMPRGKGWLCGGGHPLQIFPAMEKKELSYCIRIRLVIACSPNKAMTLSQIYIAFAERWPYFNLKDRKWQNSIRHVLSHAACFKNAARTPDDGGLGKGSWWFVTEVPEERPEFKIKASPTTAGQQKRGEPDLGSETPSLSPSPTPLTWPLHVKDDTQFLNPSTKITNVVSQEGDRGRFTHFTAPATYTTPSENTVKAVTTTITSQRTHAGGRDTPIKSPFNANQVDSLTDSMPQRIVMNGPSPSIWARQADGFNKAMRLMENRRSVQQSPLSIQIPHSPRKDYFQSNGYNYQINDPSLNTYGRYQEVTDGQHFLNLGSGSRGTAGYHQPPEMGNRQPTYSGYPREQNGEPIAMEEGHAVNHPPVFGKHYQQFDSGYVLPSSPRQEFSLEEFNRAGYAMIQGIHHNHGGHPYRMTHESQIAVRPRSARQNDNNVNNTIHPYHDQGYLPPNQSSNSGLLNHDASFPHASIDFQQSQYPRPDLPPPPSERNQEPLRPSTFPFAYSQTCQNGHDEVSIKIERQSPSETQEQQMFTQFTGRPSQHLIMQQQPHPSAMYASQFPVNGNDHDVNGLTDVGDLTSQPWSKRRKSKPSHQVDYQAAEQIHYPRYTFPTANPNQSSGANLDLHLQSQYPSGINPYQYQSQNDHQFRPATITSSIPSSSHRSRGRPKGQPNRRRSSIILSSKTRSERAQVGPSMTTYGHRSQGPGSTVSTPAPCVWVGQDGTVYPNIYVHPS